MTAWVHRENDCISPSGGASLGLVGPGGPISAALKQETCIVFDWDDTILPTSWLERIHALTNGGPMRPEIQRHMANLCAVCATTINLAATMGTVIIITNSAPGWLDQSCGLFMPQIQQLMRSLTPFFAKPMHAPLTFKIGAFRRECAKYKNVISIGDGDAERVASLRLQAQCAGQKPEFRMKSLKLHEMPTCQQLFSQHEMLQQRLTDIVTYNGCLDLKVKSGGNSLIHFSKPQQPMQPLQRSPLAPAVPDNGTNASMNALRVQSQLQRPNGGQLPPLGVGGVKDDVASGVGVAQQVGSIVNSGGPAARGNVAGSEVEQIDWKVQGVGQAQGKRSLIHGVGAKGGRIVVPGLERPKNGGAVWREQPSRGF